jgi:hypothetical protein
MKPENDIQEFFRNAAADTEPAMDEKVLARVLAAHETTHSNDPVPNRSNVRSTIMRSPITRFAIAAAIIVAVVLGLFELIGSGGTSGVAWAEVAERISASRGVIFRATEHRVPDTYEQGVDFSTSRYCATQSRLDGYKDGKLIKTIWGDCKTKTAVLVDHHRKSYVKMTGLEMPGQFRTMDPNSTIQRFLSCKHTKLGRKTIDGVLYEGIETTDPAFLGGERPPEKLTARVWASVETGYPVRLEGNYVRDNGQSRFDFVQDQFQWDVDLDASLFEPNIPPDYLDISP